MDRRDSKRDKCTKILKILQTMNIIEVNDSLTFEKEGRSYLESVLSYKRLSANNVET